MTDWVRRGKRWVIEGTQDLRDSYVPAGLQIRKRVSAGISFAAAAALLAWICTLF